MLVYLDVKEATGEIVSELKNSPSQEYQIHYAMVLRAPFGGTIASRTMDEGAVVAAGTNIVELLETAERQVRIGVSADAAATQKAGETYQFKAGGRMASGTIVAKRPARYRTPKTPPAKEELRNRN